MSQYVRANYLQRVGKLSCVRCKFETTAENFTVQDAEMAQHLEEKHPDWMTDGGKSVLPERLARGNPMAANIIISCAQAKPFPEDACMAFDKGFVCERKRGHGPSIQHYGETILSSHTWD